MEYVDLKRNFHLIKKDEEIDVEISIHDAS